METEFTERDQMLIAAYWAAVMLNIIAVPLGVLYALILLSSGSLGSAPIMGTLAPFALVGVCLIHLDVLTRAYHAKLVQHRLPWLGLVAGIGVVANIWLFLGNAMMPHGPSAVLLFPNAFGVLCSSVVCRILLATWSRRATP